MLRPNRHTTGNNPTLINHRIIVRTMSSNSYIQDISYPSSYNAQLNPLSLWFTAATNNLAVQPMSASFSYCDLGCGDGTTLHYLASMYPQAHFVGVDFNKEHITAAKQRAEGAQLENVEFRQLDFASLEELQDELFDFIVCYGTFSWINISLQEKILDFVGNRLRPDGLFLVHYAAKPGKVQIDPLWHLMRTAATTVSGDSIAQAQEGVRVISNLQQQKALFFQQNPIAHNRANALSKQNLNYIAHESLTEWQAFFHSEIEQRALQYDLTFVGPSGPLNLPLKQRVPQQFMHLFQDHMDSSTIETLCDYIHNTGVRTDIFMRKVSPQPPDQDPLTDQIFGISPLLDEMILPRIDTPSGSSIGSGEPIPKAILDGLTRQHSMTFQEIISLPTLEQRDSSEVRDYLTLMASANIIQPIIGKHKLPLASDNLKYHPTLPLARLVLASDFPLTRPLPIPSAHTGQCASLPPAVALILSLLQEGVREGQLIDRVVDRLLQAQSQIPTRGIQSPGRKELTASVSQQLPLVTDRVLPRLVAMGVFEAEG